VTARESGVGSWARDLQISREGEPLGALCFPRDEDEIWLDLEYGMQKMLFNGDADQAPGQAVTPRYWDGFQADTFVQYCCFGRKRFL
jgi:hypothetical protein